METIEFLGLNFIVGGIIVLGVFIYLIILINKRRREKFLHTTTKNEN